MGSPKSEERFVLYGLLAIALVMGVLLTVVTILARGWPEISVQRALAWIPPWRVGRAHSIRFSPI